MPKRMVKRDLKERVSARILKKASRGVKEKAGNNSGSPLGIPRSPFDTLVASGAAEGG
jgi:hypothetical protein